MIMRTSGSEAGGVGAGAAVAPATAVPEDGAVVPGGMCAVVPQPASVAEATTAIRTVSGRNTAGSFISGRGLHRFEVAAQGLVPRVGRQLGVQGGDGDAVLAHRGRAHP